MDTKEYTTRTARFTVRADGIVRAVSLPNVVETLEDAKQNSALIASIARERRVPLLVDITNIKSITKAGRRHDAKAIAPSLPHVA